MYPRTVLLFLIGSVNSCERYSFKGFDSFSSDTYSRSSRFTSVLNDGFNHLYQDGECYWEVFNIYNRYPKFLSDNCTNVYDFTNMTWFFQEYESGPVIKKDSLIVCNNKINPLTIIIGTVIFVSVLLLGKSLIDMYDYNDQGSSGT